MKTSTAYQCIKILQFQDLPSNGASSSACLWIFCGNLRQHHPRRRASSTCLTTHSYNALAVIGKTSGDLDTLLQEIITDLDCDTNTGRSILLQASETIPQVARNPALKTLAINQIGRLLGFRDPAVNYSAYQRSRVCCIVTMT